MNIENELRKNGIEVREQLNEMVKYSIIRSVATKLINTFPEYGLEANDFIARLSNLKMYRAKMPERNE